LDDGRWMNSRGEVRTSSREFIQRPSSNELEVQP